MINASCTVSHGLVHFILNMYNLQNPLYNLLQNTNFASLLNIEILNIETNFKIQLGINTACGLPCNFSWCRVATLDFLLKMNLKVRTTSTEGVYRTKYSDDMSHNSSPPSQDRPQERKRSGITCGMAGHEGLVSWTVMEFSPCAQFQNLHALLSCSVSLSAPRPGQVSPGLPAACPSSRGEAAQLLASVV